MNVVSTTGATEITHDGTTYTADATGVFDLPAEVHTAIGRLHDLVDAAGHFASRESARLAEELKPENLHARIVALEEVFAGIETHLATQVEAAVAQVTEAAKAAAKDSKGKSGKPSKAAEVKPEDPAADATTEADANAEGATS